MSTGLEVKAVQESGLTVLAIVTWAPKSVEDERRMNLTQCNDCRRYYHQVEEDFMCRVCKSPTVVVGVSPLFANKHGEPYLKVE